MGRYSDAPFRLYAAAHARSAGGVLCIQDTTELDFNGQQTEGLGTLSFPAQRGMYLHPTYAVSPEREPLGVLDAWMWVASKSASRSLPAGAKESCRWLEGYARLAEQARLLPETRLVYVADRESDFLDWMVQASALGTPVDWLIRAAHNRKLAGQQEKLWDGFTVAHVLGEVRFYLPTRRGQKAREVVQQVSARRCTLQGPDGQTFGSLLYWHRRQARPMTSSRSSGAC